MSGNVSVDEKDFAMSMPGPDLAFSRRYNSAMQETNSPMGPGWTHSLDWRLLVASRSLIVRLAELRPYDLVVLG